MTTTTTKEQFLQEAHKRGYNTFEEFDNVFEFMDFCYYEHPTDENSICQINPDGSGCIIAYED